MFSDENLFGQYPYYVLREHGKIVAGVQAAADHWNVFSLPGKFGRLSISILSKIPILNKIINKEFHFLALDGLYYATGHEASVSKLIEGLLHQHGLNNALMFLDEQSNLYQAVKGLDSGLVSKLSKPISAEVIGLFSNMTHEEIERFKKSPAYISAIDIT
jgi:hypothetical protein